MVMTNLCKKIEGPRKSQRVFMFDHFCVTVKVALYGHSAFKPEQVAGLWSGQPMRAGPLKIFSNKK